MANITQTFQPDGVCSARRAVTFGRRRTFWLATCYTIALLLAGSTVTSTAQPAIPSSLNSSDQQRIMELRARRLNAETELQANQAALNKPGNSDQQRAALSSRATQLHDEIDKAIEEERKIVK